MPLELVDANQRLHQVRAERWDEFQQRLDAGDPPSLSEALNLAPGEEFQERTKSTIASGNVKSKMAYYFNGTAVNNCHIVVEKDPNTGEYVGITFDYWTGLADALPTGPVISPEEALNIAIEHEGHSARKDSVIVEESELIIFIDEGYMTASRAYLIRYYLAVPITVRPVLFIDALTGKFLYGRHLPCHGCFESEPTKLELCCEICRHCCTIL